MVISTCQGSLFFFGLGFALFGSPQGTSRASQTHHRQETLGHRGRSSLRASSSLLFCWSHNCDVEQPSGCCVHSGLEPSFCDLSHKEAEGKRRQFCPLLCGLTLSPSLWDACCRDRLEAEAVPGLSLDSC